MRATLKLNLLALITALAVFSSPRAAHAQSTYTPPERPRFEVGIDYNYVRTNAPPGACGCFGMNGGNVTFDYTLRPHGHFDLEGDVTVVENGSVLGSHQDLRLGTYTVGMRYRPMFDSWAVQPFVHALVGAASTGGSLGSGNGTGFAGIIGGGLDLPLPQTRHISIRLAQIDYVPTTFRNGSNGVQNNFRAGAGIAFHF